MCTPLIGAVVSAGLGIAQSAMQYSAQNEAYKDNKVQAEKAFVSEQEALQRNQIGEQDAAAHDKLLMQKEATAAVAKSANIASANGVSGLSVDGLLTSIKRQEADRQEAANISLENKIMSIESEKSQSAENYVSRVKSVQKPSGMSLALGIGNALVGGFGSYYQMKSQMKA